jgi:enolase
MLSRNFKIQKIIAREILDSRGKPTVKVWLKTKDGWVTDAAPSGASRGTKEALELRDNGQEYGGEGVSQAVRNVNQIIAPLLVGRDVRQQAELDHLLIELDGTENKSRLGANALLPVSLALSRAAAKNLQLPLWKYLYQLFRNLGGNSFFRLPRPTFNILNGGVHAGNQLAFQEFMVIPEEKSFRDNLRVGAEVYQLLKKDLLKEKGKEAINVGDEGGMAPPLSKTSTALDFLQKAIIDFPESKLGLDCAANEFYKEGSYFLDGQQFNRQQLLDFYESLKEKYPLLSLEDPFAEEDWSGFQEITHRLGEEIIIVGDDLLTTHQELIKKAAQKKAANGAIIKVNQVGTLTETLQAVIEGQKHQWKIIISHRSGETNDDFIADLSVGVGADFIKAGAPVRGERVVKYNRLLLIEEEIYGRK